MKRQRIVEKIDNYTATWYGTQTAYFDGKDYTLSVSWRGGKRPRTRARDQVTVTSRRMSWTADTLDAYLTEIEETYDVDRANIKIEFVVTYGYRLGYASYDSGGATNFTFTAQETEEELAERQAQWDSWHEKFEAKVESAKRSTVMYERAKERAEREHQERMEAWAKAAKQQSQRCPTCGQELRRCHACNQPLQSPQSCRY